MRRSNTGRRAFGSGHSVAKALQASLDLGKRPPGDAGHVLKQDSARQPSADKIQPGSRKPAARAVDAAPHAPNGAGKGVILARRTAGPDGPVVGPSSKSKGERPPADAGEEVALVVPTQVVGLDIRDAPFVHVAGSDQPAGH
jgi:hypothetical protein